MENPNSRRCSSEEFVLIDLYSQRHCVREFVQSWSLEEIVDWLNHFGKVFISGHRYGQTYYFRSASGLECAFWFSDENGLQIHSV
jgi:hypothetical protein